jgi:hypothetical protein
MVVMSVTTQMTSTSLSVMSLTQNARSVRANDIRDFQVRNPGVEIETDPSHPDYGVPVATSLHQKNSILKNEKFVDKNSY